MAKKKKRERRITLSLQQLIALHQNQSALMDSILQQEQLLQNAFQEILGAEAALKEINEMGSGLKSLVSLGSGVFIEAKITSKRVKSEIGGSIVQDVSIKKALEQLEEKKKNVSSNLSKLQKQKQETANGIARLEEILQQFQQSLKERQEAPPSVS